MAEFADSTGSMSSDDKLEAAEHGHAGLVLVHAAPVGSAPRVVVVDGDTLVLGREPPRGGIALAQTAVSRVHAAVRRSAGGGLVVSDLGSRNGTFVNGERIREHVARTGDVVRVGDAIFAVVLRDAQGYADYDLRGEPVRAEVPRNLDGLVGGFAMGRLSRTIRSFAQGDATVLLRGETGVGKEVTARAVHEASGRAGAFRAINCAAIPAHLVESELFGHEKGAFTGAVRAHEGVVRSANGGTLLLDEIGDMSLDAQAKLLRVLENREVHPVGATRAVKVDVRVVCATHRDLGAALRAGTFRPDLYARIAQREILIPPLRERKEDLYGLVMHTLAARGRTEEPSISFMYRLALHAWPFNVRELVSALAYAVDMAGGGPLRTNHLPGSLAIASPSEGVGVPMASAFPELSTPLEFSAPPIFTPGAPAIPPSAPSLPAEAAARERRKGPTREELSMLLARERGNMLAVARALDRDPSQVYRWLKKYALDPDDFR